MAIHAPDLTKRPPRSPRVRLGGYALLARCLDKGRATIAGTNGEYHFNCPLDQRLLEFAGVDANALKKELGKGKGDWELLQWFQENSEHQRTDAEIAAWSSYQEQRAPSDAESRAFFNDLHSKTAPKREDIVSWADLLDVDDYVSFGGKT